MMVGLQPVGLRGLVETLRLPLATASASALALALAQACSGVLDLLPAQGLYSLRAQGWDLRKPTATKTSD